MRIMDNDYDQKFISIRDNRIARWLCKFGLKLHLWFVSAVNLSA